MAPRIARRAGGFPAVRLLVCLLLAPTSFLGQQAELISVNAAGTDSGNGQSSSDCRDFASADGRFVVFASEASNLVANDTNGAFDAFLRDRQSGTTTLISANSAGTGSGNAASFNPQISADGTRVFFRSLATNLVASPTVSGGFRQLYVRNLTNNTTALVSINTAGTGAGNEESFPEFSISVDGSRVAFPSNASNLVSNDTNGNAPDVFLRDLTAGTTSLVSVNLAGTGSGNRSSHAPSISADGTRVAFFSESNNLVGVDTNGSDGLRTDVFLRNLAAGTTTLVSANNAGSDSGNSDSLNPLISADGSRVLFASSASNLVATDTNDGIPFVGDVFMRNLAAGTTTLVSVNSAGTDSGNGESFYATPCRLISADGSRVAFVSNASDLVANDTNGQLDVFVRNLTAGPTAMASINSAGTNGGNGPSASNPSSLSADGSRVVFQSFASDLVAMDTNGGTPTGDVFVRNLEAGTTTLVSVNSAGTDSGNGESVLPGICADGSVVVFISIASDLVTTDTNGGSPTQDVFAYSLAAKKRRVQVVSE